MQIQVLGQMLGFLVLILAFTLPSSPQASSAVHKAHQDPVEEANKLADQIDKEFEQPAKKPPSTDVAKTIMLEKQAPVEETVKADAANAKEAASVAKQAAKVANKVATHSIHITAHAKKALHHALGALHDARVETEGLSKTQKDSLKKAEGRLREATKKAEYGKLKKLKEKDSVDIKKEAMQEEMDKKVTVEKSIVVNEGDLKSGKATEKDKMRAEIRALRAEVAAKGGDKELDEDLKQIEAMLDEGSNADNDEVKAEIERLREQVSKMEKPEEHVVVQQGQVNQGGGDQVYDIPKAQVTTVKSDDEDEEEKEELMKDVQLQPLEEKRQPKQSTVYSDSEAAEATPVEEKGIDIDTQMPYGDLEPFGREDTAQELTESSVRESDEMVDQLERAEVAEEKRAVFRALTRLRGAAITSFDGVARSQTGNIDEYNKIHKWRKTHPLHHLADEESDVSKWAFPDNAD